VNNSHDRLTFAGRALTRRGFLAAGSFGALALLAACSSPPASPTPAPAAPAAAAPAATATPPPAVTPVQIATAAPTATTAPAAAAATPTAAAAAAAATPTAAAAAAGANAFGKQLPADAASLDKQILVQAAGGGKVMDFNEAVYDRSPGADYFGLSLTHIDQDFNIFPGVAQAFEISKDGLSWTFHLRKGIKWSDGTELTANDYVKTFQWSADPKHAWDFTWYWSGVIKNYADAADPKKGVPTSQIGVKQGEDPYTLIVQTEQPVPYLPAQILYSWCLSAAALDKYGSGAYNTNPQQSVSCGPFILKEWSPDKRTVLQPNKAYSYTEMVPYVQGLIGNWVKGGSNFQRFQAGEVDTVEVFAPDVKAAQADAKLKDYHVYVNPQDFRVYYAFFDITQKPWDNVKVRQAFAHAVDRDNIVKNILAPLAIPVYGMLAPGFPDAVTDPLVPLANFDVAKAKQLLADAGYPNGQGFPEVTFYVRGSGPPSDPAVTQALAAGWKQNLGVNIKLQTLEQPDFMKKLNNKPTQIPFGWISYGMDYFDATNMLGVFLGGGRHSWNNAQFDKLVKDAGPMTDPEKRHAAFTDAQKLLTGDAMSIFVYNQLHGFLYQPYYKGKHLAKDKYGYDGEEWGAFPTNYGLREVYLGKDVDQYRKASIT
jgi:ABC-type transport system substrate-binding protein